MTEKLVRDRIPEIIYTKEKIRPVTRIVQGHELEELLNQKLLEESKEFAETNSLDELIDVLEVVQEIAHRKNYPLSLLERKLLQKFRTRGGFEKGIVMNFHPGQKEK